MKISIYLILILLMVGRANAQEIQLYKMYDEGKLSVRWVFQNADIWSESVLTGVKVTRTNVSTKDQKIFEIRNTTGKYLEIDKSKDDVRLYIAALFDQAVSDKSFLSQAFEEVLFTDELVNIARRDVSDRMLNLEYDLIMESGSGFIDSILEEGVQYSYRISNLEPPSSPLLIVDKEFEFNTNSYETPAIPEIKAKWTNKRVKLNWKTKDVNDYFYGYQLSVSKDNAEFSLIDSLIINPLDTSSEEVLHHITINEFLADNEVEYTFRIRGINYLGQVSKEFKEIRGKGDFGIGISPFIEKSDLLNTNEVFLKWSLPDQFKKSVIEWRIFVGEDWDGPFEIDTAGINKELYEMTRPLPYENNYFRVVAIDKNNDEFSSFPSLVTHLDTIPPAIPMNLTAIIDSAGIVDLDWDDNFEKDFYGYKVFYGFDTTREMTLAHNKAIPLSMFTDTIGLKSINRKLYYKVTSVDNRNNRSAFSKIVALIKPDILIPMEPNFHVQQSGPGQARLAWYRSTSGDVTNQRLFRKKLSDEVDWTLIKEWNNEYIDTLFTDSGLESLESYAYILTVRDSSGNESLPSTPAIVTTLPDHGDVDLEQWRVELDGKSVRFEHNFTNSEIYLIRLYRQEGDEVPFEVAKFTQEKFSWEDSAIIKDKSYQYFVQLVFEDGFQSAYSPKQIIMYE